MPYNLNENGISSSGEITLPVNMLMRSEEVNEIISQKPGFLIRWGITIFFLLLLFIIAGTFFIHYPDTILTKARLTTINAPKEVRINTDGKLIKLNAIEGKFVHKDDILGFVESRANHNQVISLSATIDSMQELMLLDNVDAIRDCLLMPYQNIGEVQPAYQNFQQSLILFKQYLSTGYYLQKKSMLQVDISYLKQLHRNLKEQKKMQQEDLELAKATFDANVTLKEQKVISPLDYRNEKSKFIGKAMTIPQINAAIISNENNQHEKQKEILQLENEIAQQKWIFTQSLNTIKAQLDDWKSKYLLTAPIDGKIAFASFFQENQQVKTNQALCFIIPENSSYYAEVSIPQSNLGKVKIGEKVLLKLPSYPYEEYGALEGKLVFISNIATDSGYVAKVVFNNGLITNYNKQVQYKDGLLAQGEVITEDLLLSDRLINSIKQFFKK